MFMGRPFRVEGGREFGQAALMSRLEKTVVTLRFHGDDLEPQMLTQALGAEPSRAAVKGIPMTSANGIERPTKTGQWLLTVETTSPAEEFDEQVRRVFDQLTGNENVWRDLSERFSGNLFVGLFLGSSDEGVVIVPDVLLLELQRVWNFSWAFMARLRTECQIFGSRSDLSDLCRKRVEYGR
jgi:hypothetical protein